MLVTRSSSSSCSNRSSRSYFSTHRDQYPLEQLEPLKRLELNLPVHSSNGSNSSSAVVPCGYDLFSFPNTRLEQLELLERLELSLLLPRLPDFHNPLLHFFLFGSHAWIGIGESIFFSRLAPLLKRNLADRDIGTERLPIDGRNLGMR